MKENNEAINILSKLSAGINTTLAFLITLFFLPTTTEFYEFNKLTLISIVTLIMLVLTSIKILLNQKTNITKSRVDSGLFLFLTSVFLATLFSLDKNLSLFGSEGRWFPSLIAFVVFGVYFYISAATIDNEKLVKQTIYAVILGITISTLISVLSFYGIHLFALDGLKTVSFNTTGSLNTAMIVAGIGLTLSIGALLNTDNIINKIALTISAIITSSYLIIVNSVNSWILLALISVVLLRLFFVHIIVKKVNAAYVLVILGIAFAITATVLIPQTRNVLYNNGYPREINLPINESWQVTASALKQRPIFGTGLGTFEINFNRYKPASLNNTVLWNVSFDKPQNEIFNVLTTMGLVGFVAMLILGSKIYSLALKSTSIKEEIAISRILAAGILIGLSSFVLTYATVVVTYITILLLAALVAQYRNQDSKEAETFTLEFTSIANIKSIDTDNTAVIKGSHIKYIAVIPIIALVIYASLILYKTYAAEAYMRMSQNALRNGEGLKVYTYQGKAINLNPRRASYHREYAKTNLLLANSLASKENLTDLDKQNIQNLISESGNRARILTEGVSPLMAANWETRGAIYRTLEKVADNALEWSAAAYENAVQLSPSNPILRVNLGGVYAAMGNNLAAANQFKIAVNLKPDYANGHYNLAKALIALNEFALAKDELNIIKKLIPADSPDQQAVDKDLAAVEEQLQKTNVAGATDERKTIEELEKTNETQPTAQQEPLTNAGQEEPIKAENLNENAIPQQ